MKAYRFILCLLLIGIFEQESFGQLKFTGEAGFILWQKEREDEVLDEDGWLNLSGLEWLGDEEIYLNEKEEKLVLETSADSNNLGYFKIVRDSVWFHPAAKTQMEYGIPEKVLQFPEENYGDLAIQTGKWKWSVIERGGSFGVRIRNLEHPAFKTFEGIPVLEYKPEWNISAKFLPRFNQSISITNVLGQVYDWNVMGMIEFTYQGKGYELITLEEDGKLWVIFSDESNAKDTYPSGRYLYVGYPDRKGNLNLDFNYAYNPPCAFTAFATCPIPPPENRLDFAILAGEMIPKSAEGH